MARKMLIDATHAEETRVAVVDGSRLVEFDYESIVRKQLRGSIFLAKVTRVEPSLQAAFVNFGGNRHGFLSFAEIHPDYYRIPVADREALLAEQRAAIEAEEAEEAEEEARRAARESEKNEDALDEDNAEADEAGEDLSAAPEEIGGGAGYAVQDDVAENGEVSGYASVPDFNSSHDEEGGREEPLPHEDGEREDALSSESGPEDSGEEMPEGEDFAKNTEADMPSDGAGEEPRRRGRFHRGRTGRGGMAYRSRRTEITGGEGDGEESGERPARRFESRRQYKIQEVIKRGQIMLIQVSKEERGNKGAAVTTYLSLPGRYCVLMPNSPRGGGVSRKIANYEDRQRMKEVLHELNVPEGMSVIVRTAGVSRSKIEIKRDLDYLLKLWDSIRDLTLKSSAPASIYEEANLVKRAVRDLYGPEIEEVWVSGSDAYHTARDFMRLLMPSHARKIHEYKDDRVPLFHRYQIENQIAAIGEPQVTLRSGGYLVINPTEALVAIDVNSGRATKERHIEETALKTNLEAADEVARQLRLRDLGGLVVVDFIDMEDRRNNARVERRLREALSTDRARIQVGRLSSFGLLELSRQRLNPSLSETQFQQCPHCKGTGRIRTPDSAAILVMRAIEEEGLSGRSSEIALHVPAEVAVYILNHKRTMLAAMEARHGFKTFVTTDESLAPSGYRIEALRPVVREDAADRNRSALAPVTGDPAAFRDASIEGDAPELAQEPGSTEGAEGGEEEFSPALQENREPRDHRGRGRGRGERGGGRGFDRPERSNRPEQRSQRPESLAPQGEEDRADRNGRRRGRRGGRGRGRGREGGGFGSRDPNAMPSANIDSIPDDIGNRRDPSEAAFHAPANEDADFAPLPSDRDGNRAPQSGHGVSVRHYGRRSAPSPESGDVDPPQPESSASPAYETVTRAPGQKKRGWWNRLVE